MNYRYVYKTLGYILLILDLLLLLPTFVCIYYKENIMPFIYTIIISFLLGFFLTRLKVSKKTYYAKEGLLITTLAWVFCSLIGALPFLISGEIPNYIDAIFETVSGFTTTGSSILTNVEVLSKGMLFWRSFTHFIGGMGILVFVIAILPNNNDNTMHVMRAEVPGPFSGKLTPKISTTAKWLYSIYIFMTLTLILLLYLGGMPLFDSVLTAFGTAGTGGFGIKVSSIAYYNSAYIDYVVGIFMMLFGINFNLYFYLVIKKYKNIFKNEELKYYLSIIIISTLLITFNIMSIYKTFGLSLRYSFFQVSSIITTTGFSTANFDLWPQFSKIILFILMFIGACGGSTGGGIKVSRIVIIFKKMINNIINLIHPNSVKSVKFEGNKLSDEVTSSIGYYTLLYLFLCIVIILIVSLDNLDFETTISSVVSCLGNIGPGFNIVGPIGSFASLSYVSKIALSIAMLLGRLELFPILLFLCPSIYVRTKRLKKNKT